MKDIQDLINGFKSFGGEYVGSSLCEQLAAGQAPKVLVIACSDSRVDPALIFKANPGDLFSIRNVANIVPKFSDHDSGVGSAIEYAVRHLKVSDILVLGHAQCGGVNAALNASDLGDEDFILDWVSHLQDAVEIAKAQSGCDSQKVCELEGVKSSLSNLMGYPWVSERVESGNLRIHGWHYDFSDGALIGFDQTKNQFETLL